MAAAAFFEARLLAGPAAGALAARFSDDFLFRRAFSFFWLFRRRIFIESLLSCLPMRGDKRIASDVSRATSQGGCKSRPARVGSAKLTRQRQVRQ